NCANQVPSGKFFQLLCRIFETLRAQPRFGSARTAVSLLGRQEHKVVELTTQYSSSAPARDVSSKKSRVAIVTGASSGIGLEAVKRLAAHGYRVVANARRITSAKTLSEAPDLKLVDGDISHSQTAQQVVSTAVQEFGRIDLLFNNAGVFIPKPF